MSRKKEKPIVYILVPEKELISRMKGYYDRAGTITFLFSKVASNQRAIGNQFMRLLHDYGRDTITSDQLTRLEKYEKENTKNNKRQA